MIEDFVVQWRKMKSALERQQQRLREAPVEGGPRKRKETQLRIAELIDRLDHLIKAHEA